MHRPRLLLMALVSTMVTVGFGPAVAPVDAALTSRLPDLAVVPPFDVRLETSSSGRRLLRFSTLVVNIGAGPLQLSGYDSLDGNATKGDTLHVRQQILQSDGTFRQRNTTATMKWAADGHNHWHILDVQWFKLQNLHGTTLLKTAKTGFCFLDSYAYGSTKPSRYNGENFVCQTSPNGTVPMGVSVRWGDVYRSSIAYQWIDITGLASGDYFIKIIADPPWETGGRFLESNESNNRGWTRIRLTKTSVSVVSKSTRP
ncbi:MAG: lysyl oxidase family protein [Chloroflexota bacterium]